MSAFEVSVTPTRIKNNKKRNEAREPTTVVLAPFSGKAIVAFEDIPITKTARRFLIIFNPSESEIEVNVTKSFKPEYNISMEWTSNVIPANSQIKMEIVWNPLMEIVTKETLQLTDSRNFVKDISVILKSKKKSPTTSKQPKHFPNISSAHFPTKVLKLKSPTPNRPGLLQRNRKLSSGSTKSADKELKSQKENLEKISPLFERNENFSQKTPDFNTIQTKKGGKENISPHTPDNASSIFDKIKFTPLSDLRSKNPNELDYLASLPTPVNRNQAEAVVVKSNIKQNIRPRRLSILSSPQEDFNNQNLRNTATTPRIDTPRRPKIVIEKPSPQSTNMLSKKCCLEEFFDPQVFSTVTKRITPDKLPKVEQLENIDTVTTTQVINKTYVLNCNTKLNDLVPLDSSRETSPSCSQIILNKTETISVGSQRLLSMIQEEERNPEEQQTDDNNLQKTFDLSIKTSDEYLIRDVKLVGTPLRKHFESMKDLSIKSPRNCSYSKGSMPNLNDMENLNSIVQNRYYHQNVLKPDDSMSSDISNISLTSSVSVPDVFFNHNEILAQSSRYNIHEIDNKSTKYSKGFKTPPPASKYRMNPYGLPKRRRSLDSPNGSVNLNVPKSSALIVSPPKRTKYDGYDAAPIRPGTNIHTKNWSRIKPKKNLVLIKNTLTPRKTIKSESRIMLYDSTLYLEPYINPDPFAATTTCDPFLASTMYLDERAVDKHTVQFKKWLNALVSIPAEFDSDCNQKIDVGRLFNEVRNKELELAKTKEQQSMNYLTKSRMDMLRKLAIQLFMSEEMRQPCSKVAVHIQKGSLKIRTDRDLRLDVVMQKYILELLLCFNPIWLRLGLEVVFGEIIPMNSNSDIIGLSTFIVNRLFKDKYLEHKYSRAYILSTEFSENMKKQTLQKFLFLLLFLDTAKNKRLIKHNPCLFLKKSQYKETKQILLKFSSELLANIGDVSRELKRLGYQLTHKQSFLDEFDYAFNNLAVDLRDGIRLTRVMEIITLRDDLTKQLRVPAISRLQRIFNVNLALKCLADSDFILTGDIQAADIVDGHREKTLSLLWQIIYKFRSPKFNAAALVIQIWWRNLWLKVVIRRRIQYKIELKRINAAIKIQSVYRAYRARNYVKLHRNQLIKSIICLQKYCRKFIIERKFKMICSSVRLIQKWYRKMKIGNQCRQEYLLKRNQIIKIQKWYRRLKLARKLEIAAPIIHEIKTNAKIQHEKAIILQKVFKSFVIHKKFQSIIYGIIRFNRQKKRKYENASRIQSFFKMIHVRREFLLKKQSAIHIQNVWRSYKLTKQIRTRFLEKKKAVLTIENHLKSFYEMKMVRKTFLQLKSSVIFIQRKYRANKLAAKERQQYLNIKTKIILIQTYFRSYLLMRNVHQEYQELKKSTIIIQRKFQAIKLMRKQQIEYNKIRNAAILIQQKYRSYLLMKKEQSEFMILKYNTIKIQKKLRATLLARKVAYDYMKLQFHTILIQQKFRANRLMREENFNYMKLKQTVLFIQRKWRGKLLMKQAQKDYQEKLKSIICIQQKFRAYKSMKLEKAKYDSKRKATIYIQQRFREYKLMKTCRNDYQQLYKATICIQQKFRAIKLMKIKKYEYQKLRSSTILIQQKFRATLLRNEIHMNFEKIRTATRLIQTRYREYKLMKEAHENYTKFRNTIIFVQQRFRANQAMRKVRNEFLQLKISTIRIQRKFRAYQLMLIDLRDFLFKRHAVVHIQRWFRCNLLARIERGLYLELQWATICVQRRFRAQLQMKRVQKKYAKLKEVTIFIQRKWRAKKSMEIAREKYLEDRKKIIFIQEKFRAKLAGRKVRVEYEQLYTSTLILQRKYRAQKEMQTVRNQYLLIKSLIICIQQKFRNYLQMKAERSSYLELRATTIFVQQKYRARILMESEREKFLKIKKTTSILQTYIRGYLARKRFNKIMTPEMREIIRKRKSAIIIQKFWRGYQIRKKWQNVRIRMVRKNLLELQKKIKPCDTLKQKLSASIRFLKGRFNVQEALSDLIRIENLSRTVPHLLLEYTDFIASFCYGVMAQAIRSEADKQIIELCSRIILNLARFNKTKSDAFQEYGLVTIAQMLLRWCDKDCGIFNTLCTLVWVFAHSQRENKKIREFMTTREAIYMLRETKKLVIRKENMRRNIRNRNLNVTTFSFNDLPNLEPDFGVLRNKPYVFVSSVFAFDSTLSKLSIEISNY